jgi:Fe-S-cluster containining protein
MDTDFSKFFKTYEGLLNTVDTAFDRVKKQYPECVKCDIRCADCCHALFDLTLIEALYINHHFNKKFQGTARERLLERANAADRKIYKIKRKAYQDHEDGKNDEVILTEIALERVRCPLLNEHDQCDLYDHRPVTCRIYGIPTAIGGKGHTCGKSAFAPGKSYPTMNMDALYEILYHISTELAAQIQSRYKIADMLVPLSMAMLTDYNEEYLGVGKTEEKNPCEIEHS